MALSLDDRLLGEKVHNYCSSSEDEGADSDDETAASPPAPDVPLPQVDPYSGHSTNTGPKGVITDWRRFKQLETEKRTEQETERLQLAKKLTLTCQSHLDEEKEKANEANLQDDIDKELEELEDEFIKEYRQKRIEEMKSFVDNLPRFYGVHSLSKEEYIDSIDQENPLVTIIIHIYEEGVAACVAMNGCLTCLAQEYPTIKFCKIKASDTKLSSKFAVNGVPALLVYKNKELIGNFISLSNEFGEDFFANDVENFLLEHGMIPDKSLKVTIVRGALDQDSDTDTDLD